MLLFYEQLSLDPSDLHRNRIEEFNAMIIEAIQQHTVTKPDTVKTRQPKPNTVKTKQKGSRTMSLCFHDGQRIRHQKSLPDAWIGVYNKETDTIVYKDKHYTSLSRFVLEHYWTKNPSKPSVDGWHMAEAEMPDGTWISTKHLPEINTASLEE